MFSIYTITISHHNALLQYFHTLITFKISVDIINLFQTESVDLAKKNSLEIRSTREEKLRKWSGNSKN